MKPPPPPPVLVVCDIWMLGVIHASSPCVEMTCSPCPSDTSRMGIVVPLISACIAAPFDWSPRERRRNAALVHKVLLTDAFGKARTKLHQAAVPGALQLAVRKG